MFMFRRKLVFPSQSRVFASIPRRKRRGKYVRHFRALHVRCPSGGNDSATTANNTVVAAAAGKRERRRVIFVFFKEEEQRTGFLRCVCCSFFDSLWVPAETANERVCWPVFFPYLFNITYVDFDHNSLTFCLVKGREKANVLSFFQSAIGLAASCPVFGCRPYFFSIAIFH